MTLVLDASRAVASSATAAGFEEFGSEELVGPPLLWSEARSALHRAVWHGVITRALGERARDLIERGPIRERSPRALGREAWNIADELGWAKTYDAEYLALARLLGCPLATLDARVARAAERLAIQTAV